MHGRVHKRPRWPLPLLVAFGTLALGGCAPHATWVRHQRPLPAVAPQPSEPPIPLEGGGGHGGNGPVHVVEKGETLYRIALRYGVDLDELMDVNQIGDPGTLAVGRELVLPPSRRSPNPGALARGAGSSQGRAASTTSAAGAGSGAARTSSSSTSVAAAPPPAETRSGNTSRPPSAQARGGLARRPPDDGAAPKLSWPVKGVVYSRFGARGASRHDGIDIAAPEGTPFGAAADGEVIFSGVQRGYGNLIIVRHEGGLVTIYAHNQKNLVKEGAQVRKGQQLGTIGRTGRATGPHLHFEVREGTKPLNPQEFLPR